MKFVLDKKGFEELTKSPEGLVGKYLKKKARQLQALAKEQVGVDSGALKRSINYRIAKDGRGLVAYVGSDNRIALMHHNGTKPHVITPKTAKTLRFYSHGKIVYAQLVHHPGTSANRYLTDNLTRVVRMK